jgi:hypothetical protein
MVVLGAIVAEVLLHPQAVKAATDSLGSGISDILTDTTTPEA